MIVFLVGFMGSGKTYWAVRLAQALGVVWTDLDQRIIQKESLAIATIFQEKGQAYFREVETSCLRSLKEQYEIKGNGENRKVTVIVATGGGTPCFDGNMDWMNENGLTVWLNPPIPKLAERLKTELEVRPLLQHLTEDGLEEFIAAKMKEREEFYRKAKLEIKNTNIAVEDFVNLILHA
jgi:shikimate kinase